MNSIHASPAVRLVFGVSHLGARQVQVQQLRQLRQQARPAASYSSTYSSPEPETTKRKPQEAAENSIDGEKKEKTGAEDGRVNGHRPGHGREIWIHNHIRDGHIMFAFDRVIDSNKGMRQMPYTGKKLVPAKIRKDYWQPLALIRFGPGNDHVGRSVFHKLREFKKRHELEWGRDNPEEEARLLRMSKHNRGKALNDQRANVIADLAAVLMGVGKGNKMWKLDWADLEDKKVMVKKGRTRIEVQLREDAQASKHERMLMQKLKIGVMESGDEKYVDWGSIKDYNVTVTEVPKVVKKKAPVAVAEEGKDGEVAEVAEGAGEAEVKVEPEPEPEPQPQREPVLFDIKSFKRLHGATVYWSFPSDRLFAAEWSENVEHVIGIPPKEKPKKANQKIEPPTTTEEEPPVAAEPASEAAQATPVAA